MFLYVYIYIHTCIYIYIYIHSHLFLYSQFALKKKTEELKMATCGLQAEPSCF
jgi:hypothetical protein